MIKGEALENATLENATLENATLENATLENATLENATLENATLENDTQPVSPAYNIRFIWKKSRGSSRFYSINFQERMAKKRVFHLPRDALVHILQYLEDTDVVSLDSVSPCIVLPRQRC